MKYRKGRLSEEERKFIAENCANKSIEELASSMGRRVEAIQKYVDKCKLSANDETDNKLAYNLKDRSFWPTLQKQFNKDELKIFEADWARTIHQFGGDITFTEEKQVVQSCTLSIMMYRTMEEIQKTKNRLEELEKLYAATLDNDSGNNDLLSSIDNQIASMRIATNSLTIQYDKIYRNFESLQKSMKATRDQRISKLVDSKTTFFEWLKQLDDENVLREASEEAEIRRVAYWKEYLLKGSQLHKYEDGSLDLPILNAETIELLPHEQETQRKVQEITKEE